MSESNVVVHSRSIATAAAVFCLLSGQTIQNGTEAQDEHWDAVVRLNQTEDSPSEVQTFDSGALAIASEEFVAAVSSAFDSLAARQQRLDPQIASAMAAEAWDLYEEA